MVCSPGRGAGSTQGARVLLHHPAGQEGQPGIFTLRLQKIWPSSVFQTFHHVHPIFTVLSDAQAQGDRRTAGLFPPETSIFALVCHNLSRGITMA